MENDKGFIRLSRRFFSDTLWNEARTFSSGEAWLDMIQSARFDAAPRKVCIGGREVVYYRGQYPASIRFLADRWKWPVKRVRNFISFLRKDGRIDVDSSQGVNIITLRNYDKYNDVGTAKGTTLGTDNYLNDNGIPQNGAQVWAQQRAHPGHSEGTKQKKEEEREEREKNLTPPPACAHTCEADFFSELRSNQPWLEAVAMSFGLHSIQPIMEWLNKFELECKCKGTIHRDTLDVRKHFYDWLRININNQTKTANGNNSRQYNTIEQQQRANLQAAAEHLKRSYEATGGYNLDVFDEIPQ